MRDFVPEAASVLTSDIDRLLLYHDRQFVELAYRLLLGREADPQGLRHYVQKLRRGDSRREVAYLIGTSAEGKEKGVNQRMFASYGRWRRLEKAPVLGGILLLAVLLFRVRHVVREFRRIQNAVYGDLATTATSVE
jgi:O-antigen chain-terminating methyltransferase